MATLYLDRAQLEIRADGAALALYEGGERSGTVPLRLLERLVIQGSQTRFDSGVLIKLAEAGIATLLLGARGSRRVALVLGPAHQDAAVRLAQAHRVMDEAYCLDWARDMVAAKLHRQQNLLRRALTERPDLRKALLDALAGLAAAAAQISGCSNVASLRGLEGAAARAHFGALTTLFPPELDFTGRNRRPPRDPVNACLSLAYTMLHFDAVRAAHAAGLDPLLGFYHRPSFGRESLACDLIEVLRPHADAWVWQQFRSRALREDHFTQHNGACVLGKAGRERFYSAWEGSAKLPRRWLRARCALLARSLRNESSTWIASRDDDEDF